VHGGEQQLSLLTADTFVDDATANHGEVFTRRWVAELILDLAGYRRDADLGSMLIVEPSCGTGAFLIPIVERLLSSVGVGNIAACRDQIVAFDVLAANAERARKEVVTLLVDAGLALDAAVGLAERWVRAGDFLLDELPMGTADFVVGNPPYVRLEEVDADTMQAYRAASTTMRGRSDLYVGFIERGLSVLKPGGALAFICADRWMHNQYGADLRELITSAHAVDTVITMHDVDAFEHEVSAYPAIVVLRNAPQGNAVVVDANRSFDASAAVGLTKWLDTDRRRTRVHRSFEATQVKGWFSGRDLWPAGSPAQLAAIADLEARFPPLQDHATATRIGIGVATGCDDIFITANENLVEADRLLPLLRAGDTTSGSVVWSGRYLVNPWDDDGLVDLARYPRLSDYLHHNRVRLRSRHVAKQRPHAWYRTIDRVDHQLVGRPKLVIPDLKAAAHPVLDDGDYYPHHNLYYVVSDRWDLEVLGGLLISEIANLFVGAYCVKMRGGCYRFQAQYLRRIRVPVLSSLTPSDKRALARAFRSRDVEAATAAAVRLYGLDGLPATS